MGKVYKDKKSSGCALCKPHKHGWEPKKKERDRFIRKIAYFHIQNQPEDRQGFVPFSDDGAGQAGTGKQVQDSESG